MFSKKSSWGGGEKGTKFLEVSLIEDIVQHVRSEVSGFGGLGVACYLQVPKFAGSNQAEAIRTFQGEKILSTPSFGREVKPWVADLRHVKDP